MQKKQIILPIILSLITFLTADTTATPQHKSEVEQETQKKKCYFMFSTDFFWHKVLESSIVTAGPCLNLGIETVRNNYFGINYYWGPINREYNQTHIVYNKTYGGGFVYKHNFPLGEIFKVSPGVQVGYWNVQWLNYDKNDEKHGPGKEHFFGGPLLALDIGYDRVCVKPEFFLSIGTGGVIPTYSAGVNFRVKESTRVRKTRFIFSTDFYWHPGRDPIKLTIGPCINMGFETKRKNYYGGNFYGPVGPGGSWQRTCGGGFVYKHNFYYGRNFIISPGAMAGFWLASWDGVNPSTYEYYKDSYYFGGPLLSLYIGSKWLFFKPEVSLLIGNGRLTPVFSIGLSFHI